MRQAIVLCYNLSPKREAQIGRLAEDAGIAPRMVEPGEYHQPLGALCGMMPMKEGIYAGQGFHDEMLLMAFFEKRMLTRFLDSFRDTSTDSVPLKAVLTPTNSQWNSVTLNEELKSEYEQFCHMQEGQ